MKLLLSIIYLFLEIMGIGMVLSVFFCTQLVKKTKRYFVGGVLLIVLECIFFHIGSDLEGVLGIYCFGWILPFFYMENFRPKKILYFYIAYNGFSIISIIVAYVWSFLLEKKYTDIIQITSYQILIDITVIVVLALYGYLSRKKTKAEVELSIGQSIVLFIGLWCFCLLTGFAQMLESEHAYTIQVGQYAGIMLSIVAVLFIALSARQQIVWKRAQEYRMQNKMYETYLGMQEEHIKDVIQGDEKMRRFRHDFHAHMIAIRALLQENKMDDLKKYVERMQEKQEEWDALRFTGIYAVDAVVREA